MKFFIIWFVVVMKMFSQILTVFLKEVKVIMRDKKSFIFGLIVPILLAPLMLIITNFSFQNSQSQAVTNVNIGISDKNNSFYAFCSAQQILTIVDAPDPKKALDSGKISAFVIVDDHLDEKILNNQDFDLNVDLNEGSMGSLMSMQVVKFYESCFREVAQNHINKDYVKNSKELQEFCIKLEIPFENPAQDQPINFSSLFFNMLVPMLLITYCCLGSASTASEISAGEKEKGTFEPLLSTGANRTSIIIGKLFATTLTGILSAFCLVLGFCGYLIISHNNKINLSPIEILALFAVTTFTAMFFAAINLAIGVYSRSVKEAQTYLVPMSTICMIPGFFVYMMDVSAIKTQWFSIPIFNVTCVLKEILAGAINFAHLGITIGWLAVYITFAVLIMIKLFKKESIVFRI